MQLNGKRERERERERERKREGGRREIKGTKKYSFIQFTHHPIYMR